MVSRELLSGSKICAVIVTFNNADRINRSAALVLQQTSKIDMLVIVNNGDESHVEQFRNLNGNPPVSVVDTGDNLGPAGGFAVGIDWAVSRGYQYVWVMDDDCYVNIDCLEHLLADIADRHGSIVYPENKHGTGPGWSGILIPAAVVSTVGLPITGLFWWIEDTEYLQYRIPIKFEFDVIYSDLAKVEHKANRSRYKAKWKYYYEARNLIIYRTRLQRRGVVSWRRYVRMLRALTRMWLRILVKENDRIVKMRYFLKGMADGFRGRLGKTLDPVD